ncbi:unnamed protein product [Heterobilharzia americana]|nr:unnamed protein product [Heterobilharzia americana]
MEQFKYYNSHGKEMVDRDIVCVLHRNGNISIYFEKMPHAKLIEDGDPNHMDQTYYPTKIQNLVYSPKYGHHQIKVPVPMIKSRTLVEFIPKSEGCAEKGICDACTKASTSTRKCYWCSRINKCGDDDDIHNIKWIRSGCYTLNVSKCQDLKFTASNQTLKVINSLLLTNHSPTSRVASVTRVFHSRKETNISKHPEDRFNTSQLQEPHTSYIFVNYYPGNVHQGWYIFITAAIMAMVPTISFAALLLLLIAKYKITIGRSQI